VPAPAIQHPFLQRQPRSIAPLTRIRPENYKTSRAGLEPQPDDGSAPQSPIVGANAFAHDIGHPPGRVPKNRLTYEDHRARTNRPRATTRLSLGNAFFPPQKKVWPQRLPGRGLRARANSLDAHDLAEAICRFKELADRKRDINRPRSSKSDRSANRPSNNRKLFITLKLSGR